MVNVPLSTKSHKMLLGIGEQREEFGECYVRCDVEAGQSLRKPQVILTVIISVKLMMIMLNMKAMTYKGGGGGGDCGDGGDIGDADGGGE